MAQRAADDMLGALEQSTAALSAEKLARRDSESQSRDIQADIMRAEHHLAHAKQSEEAIQQSFRSECELRADVESQYKAAEAKRHQLQEVFAKMRVDHDASMGKLHMERREECHAMTVEHQFALVSMKATYESKMQSFSVAEMAAAHNHEIALDRL
jgi:hypothetical protein